MDRRDIIDVHRKIAELKNELKYLEYYPYRTGYTVLMECVKEDIQHQESRIEQMEWQLKYEREGDV